MRRKIDIDLEVAARLGVDRKKIKLTTSLFLRCLRAILVEDGEVHLDNVGRLKVQVFKNKKLPLRDKIGKGYKIWVNFSKSRALKEMLHARYNEGERYGK